VSVDSESKFEAWPESWPKVIQSWTNEPCDMLIGPCACGAWHIRGEFELIRGQVVGSTGRIFSDA
jgi:hypothetical protein